MFPVKDIYLTNDYVTISHKQFITVVGPAVSTHLKRLNLGRNKAKNYWKCTQQVIAALGRTYVLHARSTKVDRALAVGYLDFDDITDNLPGHALLICFCSDSKIAYWDFTEHEEYKLSENEKRNCFHFII